MEKTSFHIKDVVSNVVYYTVEITVDPSDNFYFLFTKNVNIMNSIL